MVGFYRSPREKEFQKLLLEELRDLAETAGAEICDRFFFELREIRPATFIGEGKAAEMAEQVEREKIALVIFDENLSPAQNRNLEERLHTKVIDRTALILDIFARRARTREGKIQVELAQLKYLLPRLAGRGTEFSQLAGGIGTRGPGETRLEMDRRKVRVRIRTLGEDLRKVRQNRILHRQNRNEIPLPTVSLIGYTNAGKSTLMNRLTQAGVLVEDKLFATLDPTVRRLKLPSGREVLLADTVGFVRKLPHQLVESFQATFEEIAHSDLLLHLIDVTCEDWSDRIQTVEKVLQELRLNHQPTLRIFNKIDSGTPPSVESRPENGAISALTGEGIRDLLVKIDQKLAEDFRVVTLRIPHQAGSELAQLYKTSRVLERKDQKSGVWVKAQVSEKFFNKFKKFHTTS